MSIHKKNKWSAGQLGQMSVMCYVISTVGFVHVKGDSFNNNKSKEKELETPGINWT